MNGPLRPDPDRLLAAIQKDEAKRGQGRLFLFFGMCAGVGKTYAMLQAARQRKKEGVDVAIGWVETHGREETAALARDLPQLPRRRINYKGAALEEMDLDALLARKPQLALVDELAHTNVPGSRHPKRYQDILELLEAGIDVYTTLNVQHLESRKEAVEKIAGVPIRETVPDRIVERAAQIELIDLSPEELLKRLAEGKIYLGERIKAAAENFFREGQLTALREIALRFTAERVDQDLQTVMEAQQIRGPWNTNERMMVAVSHSPYSESLIRATRRIAYNLEAPWIAAHIDTGLSLGPADQAQLQKNLQLVRQLGGEVVTAVDSDVPGALQRLARQRNVTQIVVGRPDHRWLRDLLTGGSLLTQLVREAGEVDVHVIRQESRPYARPPFWRLTVEAGFLQYWTALWALFAVSIVSWGTLPYLGYRAVGCFFLLAILGLGLRLTAGPILFAAALSALIWNYFFIPPVGTFSISASEDIGLVVAFFVVALVVGSLASRNSRLARLQHEQEERTDLLFQVVREIAEGGEPARYLDPIMARIGYYLDGRGAVILADASGGLARRPESSYAFPFDEKDYAVASFAFQSNRPAGWMTETLPSAGAIYLPLRTPAGPCGILAYAPDDPQRHLSLAQRNLLGTIARQLAISLARWAGAPPRKP